MMGSPRESFASCATPAIPLALADNPLRVDQIVNAEICGAHYYTQAQSADSKAYLGTARIGAISILHFESQGFPRCDRRLDHIRSDNLDQFVLCLPINARIQIQHQGLTTEILPGEFLLVSTRKPIQGAMFALDVNSCSSARFVRVPASLLRERIACADEYSNQAIPIQRGTGKLMYSLLDEALAESAFFSLDDSHRVATLLVDGISHTLMSNPHRVLAECQASAGEQLLQRAKSFIDANLSDPTLNAARVAQHCHVSLRYLHSVFKPSGETLSAHIREQRLLQCRVALRNDRLRHLAIIDIAGQWGFEDPSHFSRSYKRRFGKTPSEERFLGSLSVRR